MKLIDRCSHASVPGRARRLLLVVLAALASAVAASPAGAAGHARHAAKSKAKPIPNVGIVDIYTKLGYQQSTAAGTGMILTRSGEVLTNNHVIRGATTFRVVDVTTHRKYTATVVGYSVSRDVAVLQLQHASRLKTIPLGNSGMVRRGQRVVARGNALGRGGVPRVSVGRVTALNRQIVARDDSGNSETLTNLIETSARVVPGDSGGPLENLRGRAIGMITAGSTGGARRGYAIPITRALSLARQIVAGATNHVIHVGATAFLGVSLSDAAGGGGAQIQGIVTGSAAEAAGLAAGDVITSLNGTTISSSADVQLAVLGLTPGTAVPIGWTDSAGTAQTGTITPASGPPQ
ncbi:MAG TPA: trypsin-like peptidase domain-containing protein [Gaiellaceae bacterium]|jgi:S1-C subfamily serine protease|nr:trypsin-like peptidase domain-containing protein [Gaiellaceae bacterium]